MLTDDEARDLLARAAATIDVSPCAVPAPTPLPRRRLPMVGVVAAAAVAVAAVSAIGIATSRDEAGIGPATQATEQPTAETSTTLLPFDLSLTVSNDPGGMSMERLGEPLRTTGSGAQTLSLGERPSEATAIHVVLACVTSGQFGVVGGYEFECTGQRETPTVPAGSGVFLLEQTDLSTVTVEANAGAQWQIEASYVRTEVAEWGVNANGQTFGFPNENGTPDLVQVPKVVDGQPGFVYADQLEDAAAAPERGGAFIPMYAADGQTQIGEYHVE